MLRKYKKELMLVIIITLTFAGCGLINVKGSVKTQAKVGDKEYKHEAKFDKLEELPAALSSTADALSNTTNELVKQLTDVPPPGKVKLGDLDKSLQPVEGNPDFDFLSQAQKPDGTKMDFTYVQIGVPSYDKFFKDSAEFYALTYQTKQSLFRMKNLALAILDEAGTESADVMSLVDKAMAAKVANDKLPLQTKLKEAKELMKVTVASAKAMAAKAQELVASGQQLVAGAPASITNPKTALHLDLIVEGLKQSVSVIEESSKLLTETLAQITGL